MPSAPYHLSISAARADALFASPLQRSDEPSTRQVRQAIATAIAAYGVPGCAARVAQDYGRTPRDRAHADALGAHGSGQRIRRLPGRADPRPRTRPLHRALHRPCRVSHRLKVSMPRRGPLTVTGHGTGVRARPRCTPPSGHITGVTAACVHRPDRWTEYRNPTT
jgi:hypothetical protein